MRIAISGTHFLGKTTLAHDFIVTHPEYMFQEEPYHQLMEETLFQGDLSLESFIEQLEFSLELLHSSSQVDVIFDRCPVDFAGYILALENLNEVPVAESLLHEYGNDIRKTMNSLDIIAFLPLDEKSPKHLPDDEDPELRSLVDYCLKEIYHSDILELFPDLSHVDIIEISGDRQSRVKQLESCL